MTVTPRRYTVALKPRVADAQGHTDHGDSLRTAVVEATGELGASGYPRYAGHGMRADIDPETGAIEAITVDGDELPYGWVAETVGEANGR
ncbi:hypothetical protein [Streptomyces odontomachi]|uniref:hypothetical protein n=1 Tax=Streptomyces odontomachi TaxID=2944940 RepID=UPI0021088D58|nr:hypothetical protein [Streptomyces sp. ODS25]